MLDCLTTTDWTIITGAIVAVTGLLTNCFLRSRALKLRYERMQSMIDTERKKEHEARQATIMRAKKLIDPKRKDEK
jgi:hypothetical protein